MNKARLFKEVAGAALAFHDRELWELFDNQDCFVIRVPGDERPYFASVMGAAGEMFGLAIYPGLAGLACLYEIIVDERTDPESIEESESWCVFIQALRKIPSEMRRLLDTAGFKGRRESLAPWFIVKKPGWQAREVNRSEAEIFLYALTGLLKAHDLDVLDPEPVYSSGGKLLTLTMSGDPRDPEVTVDHVAYEIPGRSYPSVIAPPSALRDLPRLDATWLAGAPVMPMSIEGDDRTVRALVVADMESGLVLNLRPILGNDLAETAAALFATFTGDGAVKQGRLPERIVIASRSLHDAVRAGLTALGVECIFDPHIDALDEIMDQFAAHSGLAADEAEDDDEADIDTSDIHEVPAPDDLDGWKAVSVRVDYRFVEWVREHGLSSDPARARYFGSVRIGDDILEEIPGARPSFDGWLGIDYRPTARSQSIAEKMLAAGLPEAERVLLEARAAANGSLYKVEDVGVDTIGLLDIASGKSVVVHDRSFPETGRPGLFMPLRVYPAGDFHFAESLGPPLNEIQLPTALEFLEQKGMSMTPGSIRGKEHLFGHLWNWRRRLERPVTRTNTDGDELSRQRATFLVEDPARVRAAFAARPDVREDPVEPEVEESVFSWLGPPTTVYPNGPILAIFDLDDDTLVINVDSDERLARARAWIEAIPGVAFERVEKVEPGSVPPPNPGEMPELEHIPEVVEALRTHLHELQMRWLDESIPAFGGKTPREFCRTEAGKSRVAAMIRCMPDAGTPIGPVAPPRELMFAELGIDPPGG